MVVINKYEFASEFKRLSEKYSVLDAPPRISIMQTL